MFLIVLLAFFVLVAILSMLGLSADSRDLRPHLPIQAPGRQANASWSEDLAGTALPPYRRVRTHLP